MLQIDNRIVAASSSVQDHINILYLFASSISLLSGGEHYLDGELERLIWRHLNKINDKSLLDKHQSGKQMIINIIVNFFVQLQKS